MDLPGFEPGAFRMQSERDTTTPRPRFTGSLGLKLPLNRQKLKLKSKKHGTFLTSQLIKILKNVD